MSSSYTNMAAGAFLGTCFVAMTLSIVSGAIYDSPNPAKEGFVIKAEMPKTDAGGPAKPDVPPIAPLLAKADVKEGEAQFKKCHACHDGTKGGPNKIGPNLWGVVGRPIASHPGFSYSSALKKFSEDGKKHWTYELLNHFIHDPRGYIAGTAMTFPGEKKDQQRADVIAYLHTLSDNPVPFPKPDEAKSGDSAAADKKPADGKTAEQKPAADADQKAADQKPAEATDQKPAEATDQKPADQKPADAGSSQ